MYFLYFFKNCGFSLVHSPAICFVFAQTQPDNYLFNAVMANKDNNSVNNDEEDEELGASTSIDEKVDEVAQVSRMDDYIQEKKRMAVEVFNIAMEKEITDAVDTSLNKWKASLSELRELKEDGSTRTDDPFFIATKAAADLHESTFHSCLARENARAAKQ